MKVKVKTQTIDTFNFIKALKVGDKSLPTVIAVFGYPVIIKKYLDYKGSFYYVDSHYNRALEYPSVKLSIHDLATRIAAELISKLKSTEVILVGYSLGALYSIELAKILKQHGIKTKLLFLIDPLDSVYNFNNKKYSILKYYICNILLHIRYYLCNIIVNTQKYTNICVINHSTFINSVYRIQLLKYNFSNVSDNTILLKRKNNAPQTNKSINSIFNTKTLKIKEFNIKKHKDFFDNKSALHSWLRILKKNI